MPKIDLSSIPGLEKAQALFGSLNSDEGGSADPIVDIMVFIYDTTPPPPPPGMFF
ncbi:MAG: hypothetical protein AAGE86_12230 [Pseudomonadota bacterium]